MEIREILNLGETSPEEGTPAGHVRQLFRPDQSCANRQSDQAGNIMNFKAIHELGAMRFHCFYTEIQALRDLLC